MENIKYQSLEEALKDFGWFTLIDDNEYREQVKNLFNPEKLDEDGVPMITTKQKTILVCDNKNWNNTYLIDLVSTVLKEKYIKPGQYMLIYCNNIKARTYIKNPAVHEKFIPQTEEGRENYEKSVLNPCIFFINPDSNVIVQLRETIGTITKDQITKYMNWLNDVFCSQHQ